MFTVSCCPGCSSTDIGQAETWWCKQCGREFDEPATTELVPEGNTRLMSDILDAGGSV